MEDVHRRRLEAAELGDLEEGARRLSAYLAAVREHHQDPEAYINLARFYRQLRRLEEALVWLKQGVARCAPSPRLYNQYIKRLEECNRTEEAIEAARMALWAFPDNFLLALREATILPVSTKQRRTSNAIGTVMPKA
jgi:tetratricopeptide (TPR) repeat protein